MNKEKLYLFVFSILFFGVGIFLLVFFANNQMKLMERCTKQTEGTVTKVEIETDVDDNTDIYVTVEYKVGDETYEIRKNSGEEYKENEKLEVKYNPDDPAETYIPGVDSTVGSIRVGGIIFVAIGVICLVAAIFKN